MKTVAEKRRSERRPCCVDLDYSFRGRPTRFRARSLNSSTGGVCFQTGYAMTPGIRITLFCSASLPGCDDEPAGGGRSAEVRWCRTLPDHDAFFYQVGVAFT